MSSKESKHKYADCIPQSTLIAYIRDELSGRERNAVERHLSICTMCADVLDGLSELEDPNEIYEVESDINSAIDKSIANKSVGTFQYKTLLNVAASVTLVLAVSSLIYYFITIMPSNTVLSEGLLIEEEIMPLDLKDIEPPSEPLQNDKPEEEAALEIGQEEKQKQKQKQKEPIVGLKGSSRTASVDRAKKTEKSQPPKPMKVTESINIVDDDIEIEATFDVDERVLEKEEQLNEYQLQSGVFIDEEEVHEDEVFMVVEEMPTFIGDNKHKDFKEYISKNIKYPEFAAESGIQGRVFVQFIVEPDGSVSNVEVLRGVDPELDKEAVRVVKNSPKWEPGKQRGTPVRVSFSFPVIFTLE